MNEIKQYNYNLVKKDIENIYRILCDLQTEKDFPVLILGWFQYFALLCVEGKKYTATGMKLKNKKEIENCRAKVKPLEGNYDKICDQLKQLNIKKMYRFANLAAQNGYITDDKILNYGVYKIDNKIMGNTFLYEHLYKKIIYKNDEANSDKIIKVSEEVGRTLAQLMKYFQLKNTYVGKENKINIKLEDYNMICNKNKLLNESVDTNEGLILLNSISLMNFYRYIICKMNVRKELKYRLGYIVYYSTYKDILKIIGTSKKIQLDVTKYNFLDSIEYRNCMFHYNLDQDINDEEFIDEMYGGIIHKYLGLTEREYIKSIDDYFNEITDGLEKLVLKQDKQIY